MLTFASVFFERMTKINRVCHTRDTEISLGVEVAGTTNEMRRKIWTNSEGDDASWTFGSKLKQLYQETLATMHNVGIMEEEECYCVWGHNI